MSCKKEEARLMYMINTCTQRQIANNLDVSERTVYNWIHDNAWDQLRKASKAAPVYIADNICNQIIELQTEIANRPSGKRYPTPQEAEVTRKLINSLEKVKRYPSLSQSIQVIETFRQFIKPKIDKSVGRTISILADVFMEGQAKNGYRPHELECGIDPVPPYPECDPTTCQSQGEEEKEEAYHYTTHPLPPEPQTETKPEVPPNTLSQPTRFLACKPTGFPSCNPTRFPAFFQGELVPPLRQEDAAKKPAGLFFAAGVVNTLHEHNPQNQPTHKDTPLTKTGNSTQPETTTQIIDNEPNRLKPAFPNQQKPETPARPPITK